MDIAPVMALVLNILSKLILAGDGSVSCEELAAVFGPSVILGFETGGLADLEEFVAMGQGPIELLMDGFSTAGRDEQSVMAVLDEIGAAGTGGAKDGHATGHGLEDDEAEAFRDGG